MDDLKADVLEIAAIAAACPEALQEKCFELLLQYYLQRRQGPAAPSHEVAVDAEGESRERGQTESDATPTDDAGQEDIALVDLHVKTRRFLQKYNLSIEDINQIFYKEGSSILPLYDDLRTTRMAETQIRIALLQALRNAIDTGEFEFSGEDVRSECQARKSYDAGNFTANFKNNASLFEGFEKYDRSAPLIRLAEDGRKELAELMRELQ